MMQTVGNLGLQVSNICAVGVDVVLKATALIQSS